MEYNVVLETARCIEVETGDTAGEYRDMRRRETGGLLHTTGVASRKERLVTLNLDEKCETSK